jgi:hypothetical protein
MPATIPSSLEQDQEQVQEDQAQADLDQVQVQVQDQVQEDQAQADLDQIQDQAQEDQAQADLDQVQDQVQEDQALADRDQWYVGPTLSTTVLECVFAIQVTTNLDQSVFKVSNVEQILLKLLQDHANALQVLLTTMEFALNVLLVLFIVQLPKPVCMSVVKIHCTPIPQTHVYVFQDTV